MQLLTLKIQELSHENSNKVSCVRVEPPNGFKIQEFSNETLNTKFNRFS